MTPIERLAQADARRWRREYMSTPTMLGMRVRGWNRHSTRPYVGRLEGWSAQDRGVGLVRLDDGAIIPLTEVEVVGDEDKETERA